MPKIKEEVGKLFSREPNSEINPDEVVAIGAAVQAGIFQGDVKDVLLLDVTPLSLGIETMGGVGTVLIPKNTTVPTNKKNVFSTAADNQTSVEINVVQGERSMASDNKTLGRFILDGIAPAPRGLPKVEVSFDIDANGILNVSAEDKATSKSQSIKIEGSTGMSDEEVEKMKMEAQRHEEDDKKKRELIDARNQAEAVIYSSNKTLKELDEKIEDSVKEEVKSKLEDLEKVKDSDDKDTIEKAIAELSQTLQKIGTEMYKDADKEQGPEDAQYEEKI